MADGYARVTARPGVVCTTAGPGATNALTGVAEAWADSVPLLLIAGQVNAGDLDRECGNYHEIDLESIFRPVTKWCGTVRQVEQIPAMTGQAFQAMTIGRPRPAAIFVPQDLMRESCAKVDLPPHPSPPPPPQVSQNEVLRAAEVLKAARRPIILAGGGALWSGAGERIREIAHGSAAPSSRPSMRRDLSTSVIPFRSATPVPSAPGKPCPTPTRCWPLAAGSPRCLPTGGECLCPASSYRLISMPARSA